MLRSALLAAVLAGLPLHHAVPMTSSLPLCFDSTIVSQLRVWLDPIPRHPDGALPPGVIAPPSPPRGPETHALNLELSLHNTSSNSHSARVISAHWHQGQGNHPLSWSIQPDLSPLNRFSHIQRELVILTDDQPLKVELVLELNGTHCRLEAHIPSSDIPKTRR